MMNEEQQKEMAKYIVSLQEAYDQEQQSKARMSGQMANSIFATASNQNLIEYQLGLDDILERIDHLLRGHVLKQDEKGNYLWEEPKDDNLKVFNEYGVQEVLRILQMYLNRNTILSNYDEETIKWKVYDIGIRLINLIFNRYEDLFYLPDKDKLRAMFIKNLEEGYYLEEETQRFFDNIDYAELEILEIRRDILLNKIKFYEMIVGMILDTIHSAYLRALNGGERLSLREARMVTQTDNMNQQNLNPMQMMNQKKFSILKPTTWFG